MIFLTFLIEKLPNITFYKKPSSGRRFISCGRTDRQTWQS